MIIILLINISAADNLTISQRITGSLRQLAINPATKLCLDYLEYEQNKVKLRDQISNLWEEIKSDDIDEHMKKQLIREFEQRSKKHLQYQLRIALCFSNCIINNILEVA